MYDPRYAAVNTLLLDYYEESCLDYSYDEMIEEIRNTSWAGDGADSGGLLILHKLYLLIKCFALTAKSLSHKKIFSNSLYFLVSN